GSPFTMAHASWFLAMLLVLDEDWGEARREAARVAKLSDDYGFTLWHGNALAILGRVVAEEGELARGIARIRQGIDLRRSKGLRLASAVHLSLLAGACLRGEQVAEGLSAVDQGVADCEETGARCFEPELWRLRGALLLRRVPDRGPARRAAICAAE